MKVKINSINEALKFSRIAEKFDENVDVTDGHYVVDGKSHMGLVMICANGNPLEVKIVTDDMSRWAAFRNAIVDFLDVE